MFTNLNIMYLYLKISLVFDNHCFLNNVNIKDFLPAVWKTLCAKTGFLINSGPALQHNAQNRK